MRGKIPIPLINSESSKTNNGIPRVRGCGGGFDEYKPEVVLHVQLGAGGTGWIRALALNPHRLHICVFVNYIPRGVIELVVVNKTLCQIGKFVLTEQTHR